MVLTMVVNPMMMSAYLALFLFDSNSDILRFFGALGAVHGFRMVRVSLESIC